MRLTDMECTSTLALAERKEYVDLDASLGHYDSTRGYHNMLQEKQLYKQCICQK
jgi:hypothetical protein